MIDVFALDVLLRWWQSTAKNDQPLISATNPTYLGCSVWNGNEWTPPASRSARTPTLRSPKGFRHLIDRMRDRAISIADLNQLRLWIASQPEVPEGD